jgi:Protease inhibitor Inh
MRTLLIAAALAAGLGAGQALAQDQKGPDDHEAGVPLTPAEAAGAWTVSTGGRDVCTITLTAAHGVTSPPACASVLPGAPTAWQPTSDGMQLTGGGTAIAFHRWSNSLFVSQRASHLDVQLRRGGPVPPA